VKEVRRIVVLEAVFVSDGTGRLAKKLVVAPSTVEPVDEEVVQYYVVLEAVFLHDRTGQLVEEPIETWSMIVGVDLRAVRQSLVLEEACRYDANGQLAAEQIETPSMAEPAEVKEALQCAVQELAQTIATVPSDGAAVEEETVRTLEHAHVPVYPLLATMLVLAMILSRPAKVLLWAALGKAPAQLAKYCDIVEGDYCAIVAVGELDIQGWWIVLVEAAIGPRTLYNWHLVHVDAGNTARALAMGRRSCATVVATAVEVAEVAKTAPAASTVNTVAAACTAHLRGSRGKLARR
jgi:hypothetical protein